MNKIFLTACLGFLLYQPARTGVCTGNLSTEASFHAEEYITTPQQDEYALPFIDAEEVHEIEMIIREWLDYYGLDINSARLFRTSAIDLLSPPDEENLYRMEFTPEMDRDDNICVEYSPGKRRFVDVGNWFWYYDEQQGDYVVLCEGDDSQAIYFTDRDLRQVHFIKWFGGSELGEAVFWRDDDFFVLAGYSRGNALERIFITFDIRNGLSKEYWITAPDTKIESDYMEKVVRREKYEILVKSADNSID